MKLLKYKKITGIICCITGLHIGGSAETIEIGGIGNPIIRHPINDFPYIPGSSLKGKIRSLLEWYLDKVEPDGSVHKWCGDNECPICRIFGTSAGEESQTGPTRLIVRDAILTEESQKKLIELREKKGLLYAEAKWENVINRLNASANPRQIERVPAGIEFTFEMTYRVFDGINEQGKNIDEELFKNVEKGLELLQQDALGGSGSRGYGKIEIEYKVE